MNVAYQLLDAMGITFWRQRYPASLLICGNPLFCAACLVILPEKLPKEEIEQNQILSGMLKVLELNEDEISVISVSDVVKLQEFDLIGREIASWAPYSILIMGEALAKQLLKSDRSMDDLRACFQSWLGLDSIIQVTYHPAEMQKIKECKRKAYEDLLRLKECLSLARAT